MSVNQNKVNSKKHKAKLDRLSTPVRMGDKAKVSKITTSFNRNGSMVK